MKRCYCCMQEYDPTFGMCPHCGNEIVTKPRDMFHLCPGELIQERYEVGLSVGAGGFGITYIAWDRLLKKVVAIKEYYPAGLVNRVPGEKNLIIYSGNRERDFMNGKVRFLEEARHMAKFNTHANIINVYDFFEENDTAYIVMEFLDGVTYKEYIKENGGKVSPEKALEITDAVMNALEEVHNNNILHRDISPDNIYLCKDGKIKLLDFGAASFSSTDTELTRFIVLKPGFAPPEQYQTKSKQGPWTDIYALGATLYQSVTGMKPQESVNRTEEDNLVAPHKLCDNVTQNLSNAIMRAMALQPEIRFQTIREFRAALSSQKNIRDVEKEIKARKTKRLISMVAAFAVVAAGIGICLFALNQKKKEAGVLEAANITVWVCAREGEDAAAAEERYKQALEEYRSTYPQVGVSIQGFTQEEYAGKVEQAAGNGTLPTLLESTDLSTKYYSQFADLSGVVKSLDMTGYYFLNDYAKYFPAGKAIPTAVRIPVVYYNTVLTEQAGSDLTALLENGGCKVTARNYLTYYNMTAAEKVGFPALPEQPAEKGVCVGAQDMFLNNETAALIGDTGIYGLVEKGLAGYFRVEVIDKNQAVGEFRDCFSVSDKASSEEKAAAMQAIVFLMAESAQDVLNIRNVNEIPLNRKMYETYVSVNPQLAGLEKCFDKLIFAGENQQKANEWYVQLGE